MAAYLSTYRQRAPLDAISYRTLTVYRTGMAQLGEGLGCGRAIGPPEVGECVTQIARQIEGATTLGDG